MLNKFKVIFSLIFVMTAVSSCGDLYSKHEKVQEDSFSQFASCSIDTNKLTGIFKEDIGTTLVCLERSIKLFIDVVEVEKPGYLSHRALKKYIAKNMPDISPDTLKALSVIFDINHLLFNDHLNFISEKNVEKLMSLLTDVNQIMVKNNILDFFRDGKSVSFTEHNRRKSIIFNVLKKLSNRFSGEIIDNENKINIYSIIEKFKSEEEIEKAKTCEKAAVECEKTIIDYVKALSFVKKSILGGSNKTITGSELKRLIILLPKFSKILYDFSKMSETKHSSGKDSEILGILRSDTRTLEAMLYYADKPEEVLFTFSDIENAVKTFAPKFVKFFKYKKEIKIIKNILLNNNSLNISALDAVNILSELRENFDRGVFFYRTYDQNKEMLDSPFPIYGRLQMFTESVNEKVFRSDFNRIISDYRFYKGREFSPEFGIDNVRNARGVFEISLLEYLSRKVLAVYGKQDLDAVGGFSMSQDQLGHLLLDFSDLLVGEEFLRKDRELTSAETITLMMSIFHTQSNGDSKIEIPEIVEFAITVLTSMNLKDEMFGFMTERCISTAGDNEVKYSAQCFRDNFREFIKKPRGNRHVGEYTPQLSSYIANTTDEILDTYLSKVSTFSRACSYFDDGVEVPMTNGDGMVVWAGLLVIEQTMIKFDVNNNNILDPEEVDEAYPMFESAIKAMIPGDFLKPLAKSFYLYIVRYQRIPDVAGIESWSDFYKAAKDGAHFAKFYLGTKTRGAYQTVKGWFGARHTKIVSKASADRMTFATVLQIISDNSPAKKKLPFDCDVLR